MRITALLDILSLGLRNASLRRRDKVSEIRLSVDPDALARVFPEVFLENRPKDVVKLAGDASTREYYRVVCSPGVSFILQVADPYLATELDRHPFLSARALLEEWKVPVPRRVGFNPDLGWVLLEDLGDTTLQNEASLEHYRCAIDLLVRWTKEGLSSHRRTIHFDWAFDYSKLQAEMEFTAEHLWTGLLHQESQPFLSAVSENSRYLSERPRFFCHRDYHCRNLMLHHGKLFVIDFQDARLGPITYDLVSLLWDPYVRLSESWRSQLLNYWKEQVLKPEPMSGGSVSVPRQIIDAMGEGLSLSDWKVEIERMKVQRLLKAAGSYASFFRKKGRRDYLPSVFPALEDTKVALGNLLATSGATESDARLLSLLGSVDLSPLGPLTQEIP